MSGEAEWVAVLRAECATSSQKEVARRIRYSQATVSQVLSGTYGGDLAAVRMAVEGGLMHAELECPVLGPIGREQCREHQNRGFSATNPARVALWKACKGCPNNRRTAGRAGGGA